MLLRHDEVRLLATWLLLSVTIGVLSAALRPCWAALFRRKGSAPPFAAALAGVGLGRALSVLGASTIFMVVGPALMMLNKHIMQKLHFPYPLSLGGLGMLASFLLSHSCAALGVVTIRRESLDVTRGRKWLWTALPIGACKACTLATGNAAYLHLGLGFIQMLKAFTPAVVLIVMRVLGTARERRVAVWCVYIIVVGTMVEVKGELHVTALGLLLMVVSEVTEAVNLVLTQRLLQNSHFTVWEGLYVTAPPGCLCLFSAAAVLEWPEMARNHQWLLVREHPAFFAAAASLGFAVNFVGTILLQTTSSLFCKILNTARSVGLVVVGVVLYGEQCTLLEACGYMLALLGFAGYNYALIFPTEAERFAERLDSLCAKPATLLSVASAEELAADSPKARVL